MRNLTLIPIYQKSSLDMIAKLVAQELPADFVKFMLVYGGRAVRESIYLNEIRKTYSVNNYLPPWEVNTILQEWSKIDENEMLPFAIEGSGSYLCYSLQAVTFGKIVLSRVDHEGKVSFKEVEKSLELFIDKLITPAEFQKNYFGQ
ncbi:SMI1/KNR4 family protein [Saprospiraceae bacterium]|nr:SMI1/KNR4 family protein [Saprospiraceae bacterium]